MRKYFRRLSQVDIYLEEDPADIHPEFVTIAKLLIEANNNHTKKKKLVDQGLQQSKVNLIKVPELLLRNRKFNQMEIEMDKFLAKKNAIFKDDHAKSKAKTTQSNKSKDTNIKEVKSLGFSQINTDQAMRYKMNSCIL